MPDFHTQLGDPHPGDPQRRDQSCPGGLFSEKRRFVRGQNPYVQGTVLSSSSPVFYGRDAILHSIRSRLLSPDKPQSACLLGERRIGKSSLLNRLIRSLAAEPGLLILQASTQGWSDIDPPGFFRSLHLGLCRGRGMKAPAQPFDYFEGVRDLMEKVSPLYRFIIVFDEIALGIVAGVWLDPLWIRVSLVVVGSTVFLLGSASVLSWHYRERDISDAAGNVLAAMWLFGIPLTGFGLLPSASVAEVDPWGMALMTAFGFGFLIVFFRYDSHDKKATYYAFSHRKLRRHGEK